MGLKKKIKRKKKKEKKENKKEEKTAVIKEPLHREQKGFLSPPSLEMPLCCLPQGAKA